MSILPYELATLRMLIFNESHSPHLADLQEYA